MGAADSVGRRFGAVIAVSVVFLAIPLTGYQQSPPTAPSHTQVVLLGTGDPAADPDQSGPATAVIVNDTPPTSSILADGHVVNAHEVLAGVVYRDGNVTVTAFPTKHAMESYGYRFDTPDRRIVISGDTNPTQATIDACHGCDVLIHEMRSLEGLAKRPPAFQRFASRYHTTTVQLAELATQAKPRLLILYHHAIALRPELNPGASLSAELLSEVSAHYAGHVVVGHDLDVY